MLVKLLPNQIPYYREIVEETIERTYDYCDDEIKTNIYKELLLDLCQCWISHDDETKEFDGVMLTQIRNDLAIGRKTLTILALHAPEDPSAESFMTGFELIKKFAKKHNCHHLDFYSNSPAVMQRANLFNVKLKTNYVQIEI